MARRPLLLFLAVLAVGLAALLAGRCDRDRGGEPAPAGVVPVDPADRAALDAAAATPERYRRVDPAELLTIHAPSDVAVLRARLCTFLWGRPLPPATLPASLRRDVEIDGWSDLAHAARVDLIVVAMDSGLESRVFRCAPAETTGRTVLYHQGHAPDARHDAELVDALLADGHAVLVFAMPLTGPNNRPEVELPRLGRLRLTTHEHLKFLRPERGHPVGYLVEPVVAVLNQLAREGVDEVAMVGLGGGGWTTTLAAAVDPRIALSVPVAGGYPLYLRSEAPPDRGDWEQTVPALYRTVNHLELYVLGASGPGRRQVQVVNKYDPAGCGGMKWETYADVVVERVDMLGAGSFEVFVDDTHRSRAVSPAARTRLRAALEGS